MKTALLLALLLVACSRVADTPSPRPQQDQPAAQENVQPAPSGASTDKQHYAMVEGPYGPLTVITTTLTAPHDKRIYITNCNGAMSVGLQQQVVSEWKDVWSPAMNACLSLPIVIEPAKSLTTTITPASGAHAAIDSVANGTNIEGGTYRVAWHGVYTSFDMNKQPWGEELPLSDRVSPPFSIAPPSPPDPRRTSPAQPPQEIRFFDPQHLEVVDARHAVSIGFSAPQSTLRGEPQLYIDRGWIEKPERIYLESKPRAGLELQHEPKKNWSAGRHDARVIYQHKDGTTRWFAWSFVVK
jgi:hypothetical protein